MKIKNGKQISEEAKARLQFYANLHKKKWEKWREAARLEAKREFNDFAQNPLFIAGISLYWGEGDRKMKNGLVRLGNTDWRIITLFIKFLEKIAKVPKEKIKLSLTLYPDLSEEKCKIFWSQKCKIPLKQFYKTQFIRGRHPTKRLSYGICSVVVSSRRLKEKIFTWINLFAQTHFE